MRFYNYISAIILLTIGSLIISCSEESSTGDNVCFSFDIRQCATDSWLDFTVMDNESTLLAKTEVYLEGRGISLEDITVVMNFHEFVCEACGVCPKGPRIFIKTPPASEDILRSLPLLSLESTDCDLIN